MADVEYQIPHFHELALRTVTAAFPWSGAGRARRRLREASVEPPLPVLAGSTLLLPGRGETFVRDSGGQGPTLLLLHGWVVSADLNWIRCYEPLVAAGYRVVAIDHRGHGRGIRSPAPFRLRDCAADAAAVVEQLGAPTIELAADHLAPGAPDSRFADALLHAIAAVRPRSRAEEASDGAHAVSVRP